MFAPQMLINQLSLYHLETSVEYGGMKAFKKWSASPKIKKENKKIFWNFSDLFFSRKYNPTNPPIEIIRNKKYQPLNISIFILSPTTLYVLLYNIWNM